MHGFRYPYSEEKYAICILPDQFEVGGCHCESFVDTFEWQSKPMLLLALSSFLHCLWYFVAGWPVSSES